MAHSKSATSEHLHQFPGAGLLKGEFAQSFFGLHQSLGLVLDACCMVPAKGVETFNRAFGRGWLCCQWLISYRRWVFQGLAEVVFRLPKEVDMAVDKPG